VFGSAVLSGCSFSSIPVSGRPAIAEGVGIASADIWLLTAKPSATVVSTLETVTGAVSSGVNGYVHGGFVAAQPAVQAVVDAKLTDPMQRAIADAFLPVLLGELDVLFNGHPGWSALGNETGTLVAAFCSGVNNTLKGYVPPSTSALARAEAPPAFQVIQFYQVTTAFPKATVVPVK
jgi:hypothetical protein